MEISEKNFEEIIECALLAGGPDVCEGEAGKIREPSPEWEIFGEYLPGGYRRRKHEDYNRGLCLDPGPVFDFIYGTQPDEWQKFKDHYGEEAKQRFLTRLSREIKRRGTLDVLRKGIKDVGCKFRMAYFRPSSGLNEELERLYQGNVFTVIRQLHYSQKNENSLDLGLFLNGIPIFTAELKNPLNGQTYENAIRQYCFDRDPREPLFAHGRCLAHFAVDPNQVYVATRLEKKDTDFLPFNRGKFGGAGNPPTQSGFDTAYLWEQVWARDSVLELIQHFIHMIDLEDDEGKRTGERLLIFPRYHQLSCVRSLVADARKNGSGRWYLIQHSAGSGKSNSIAWLAHQLSVLHDAEDWRVFSSIVIITDRRVLDRQLQRTVRQFQQTLGVVENIEKTSVQLKEALEAGKTIIVSTLQKFPVIADQISELPQKRFALIIDEAHSSQTGESTKSLKSVLSAVSLEEAEAEEQKEGEDAEDRIVAEMKKRGHLPNVSTFAFTATPKAKTLELFGTKWEDGRFEAFSTYTMRQAIEERFILDVLENYTTYKVYWNLLKKVEQDPQFDRTKTAYLLRRFVDLHEHSIAKKVEVMVEHFAEKVASRIGGRAKAMIVARSRLHAVRYKLALDKYLREQKYPFESLVAFSGTVRDGGADFTEAGMNGVREKQTAETFDQDKYRFLVVAYKFQTGFDQPLLHTMYVDQKLGGVQAVQTLSRLNRKYHGKEETFVLDFANEAEDIQESFQPYYEKTLLTEATDPNLLYTLQGELLDFHVYDEADVNRFADVFFADKEKKPTQDQLYAALGPAVDRYKELDEDAQVEFRGKLDDYTRLYAFLSQVITFTDADLEKLYVFCRFLRRILPPRKGDPPPPIRELVDMESFRMRKTFEDRIKLQRGPGEVESQKPGEHRTIEEELEMLSRIIKELNEQFGTDFRDEDKVFIELLEEKLAGQESLANAVRTNPRENARLSFDHVAQDELQDMVDTNFKFYKRITEDDDFGKFLFDWLFERFVKRVGGN